MSTNMEYSDEIATRIDSQVKQIVETCHLEAIKIIKENRVIIDYLVDLLIEKETIDGGEFKTIITDYTSVPAKNKYSLIS